MWLPLFLRLTCIFKANKMDHTAVNQLNQEVVVSETWSVSLLQR